MLNKCRFLSCNYLQIHIQVSQQQLFPRPNLHLLCALGDQVCAAEFSGSSALLVASLPHCLDRGQDDFGC